MASSSRRWKKSGSAASSTAPAFRTTRSPSAWRWAASRRPMSTSSPSRAIRARTSGARRCSCCGTGRRGTVASTRAQPGQPACAPADAREVARPRRRGRASAARGSSSITRRTWPAPLRVAVRRGGGLRDRRLRRLRQHVVGPRRRNAACPSTGASSFPHSLGLLYLAITQYLGFPNYGDEFKVMGLAPYGEPRFAREIESLVQLKDDGRFELDLSYFRHWSEGVQMTWEDGEPTIGAVFTPKLESLLGPARRREEPLEAQHEAIAASLQVAFEARRPPRAPARAEVDRQHAALPCRRLRDEQRRQRQDPRADRIPRGLHPAGGGRQRHRARRGVLRLPPDRTGAHAAS